MLNVTFVGLTDVIAHFTAMPDRLHTALLRKVTTLALLLEARVKAKLSGQVLNVRTGALRRSIFNEVTDSSTSVTAKVASGGDVKYAAIHEFGGKTAAHEILPNKAKALAFMMGGKQVFAKRVNHPGSVMPERSYMRSSLTDMRSEIVDGLHKAASEGLRAQ